MKVIKLFLVDKRNIKCLGIVQIELHPFIKRKVADFGESPLESIRAVFPISRPPTAIENKKVNNEIGSIEIEVTCEFGGRYEHKIPKQVTTFGGKTDKEMDFKIIDNKSNARIIEPNKRPKEQMNRVQKIDQVDLSQLIHRTEELINEMDFEVDQNDKNRKFNLKVQEIEETLKEEKVSHFIPKNLSAEVELEILKMQKYSLQKNQREFANSNTSNKINELFESHQTNPKFITINLEQLEVESPVYQKSLSENLSFVQLTLTDENDVLLETHKFIKKSNREQWQRRQIFPD